MYVKHLFIQLFIISQCRVADRHPVNGAELERAGGQ